MHSGNVQVHGISPPRTSRVAGRIGAPFPRKETTMFDITSQAVVDTAPVHLKGADGEHLFDAKGNPLQIVIFGPGSRQFAAIEARQTARAVKRMADNDGKRSEEHTSELQSLMRISYAVFCLKKKKTSTINKHAYSYQMSLKHN